MYLAHYELKSVMIMMMIIIIIIIIIIVVVNIVLVITRATIVTFLGRLLHRPASHSPVMAPVSLALCLEQGSLPPFRRRHVQCRANTQSLVLVSVRVSVRMMDAYATHVISISSTTYVSILASSVDLPPQSRKFK